MSVAVVIPAHNASPWLRSAIESCLLQGDAVDQVVVVNDGSTDDSSTIAHSYGGKVRVVDQVNQGVSAARNAGASAATADWIFFLDADDALFPDAVQTMLGAVDRHPGVAAVVPNALVRHSNRSHMRFTTRRAERVLDTRALPGLCRKNWLAANGLVRREVWADVRFDEATAGSADLDFWIRVLTSGSRILALGAPQFLARSDYLGAMSRDVLAMRTSRNYVVRKLLKDPGAPGVARFAAALAWAKSRLGIRVASRKNSVAAPVALQIRLDEIGGGREHVRLIHEAIGSAVKIRELALPPPFGPGQRLPLRSAWRLWRASRDVDVLHAHGMRAATLAIPVAKVRHARCVVTIHGLHSMRRTSGMRHRLAVWGNRLVLRSADVVCALSHSDRDALVSNRLVRPTRVHLTQAAVHPPPFVDRAKARAELGLDETTPVVLWLGRLADQKDPLTFVDAASALATRRAVIALMVGDGPLAAAVDAAIGARDSSDAIRRTGWLEAPAVAFRAADVFVSTSTYEGLAIAALEAGASGLPLVVTDSPGNRDLPKFGIPTTLVPPRDATALAAALDELLTRALSDLGAATERAVRDAFPLEAFRDDLLRVYAS